MAEDCAKYSQAIHFNYTHEVQLPTENCVCGQQAGRTCPVHPDRPVEFRTINGPPLPDGAEVPWVDPEDDGLDQDWENQIAARAEHDGISPDRNAADAAAEAILAAQNQPGQREAFDLAFAMNSEELGRAAVEDAAERERKDLSPP